MTGLPRLTITAALAVLLTSLSLQPTLADGTWMLPTILCVAAVAGTGYLARRMSVPRVLIPVVEVGVLVVLLILRFAQDVAVWGVLPGRDVRLETRTLLDEAFDTISSYAPPAPLTPGLIFLLTMAVALVAVVVDTVAVTYRSPALAGLPLLVLYAVPVSVVANGVSWVYFCLAAVGWLALLLADGRERLGGWGRRLGTRTFAGDPTANNVQVVAEPLGAVGRRIGLAAVALAVVLPAIVPGLSEAVFGRGLGAGTGGGGNTVNTINPYVSLGADLNRPQDTEVLRYTTTAAKPDYLRLVTLDTFDGKIWEPANLKTSGRVTQGPLPPPVGVSTGTPVTAVTTEITTTELTTSTWLPAPYAIMSVAVEGDTAEDWVWDTTNRLVWSAEGNTENLRYTVQSLSISPDRTALAQTPSLDPVFAATYTKLPDNVSDTVRQIAVEATEGAETPYATALALQKFFRSGQFVYDTSAAPATNDPLTSFLSSRRGFCQQFAGAFAVMARSLQLPTRVVVGFVPGDRQADGSWSVSWHDTHAWPEVYFEGAGWTRFEPTPSDGNAGITIPPYTVPLQDDNGGERPEISESANPGGPSSSASGSAVLGGIAPEERDRDSASSLAQSNDFPWAWVLVPLASIAVLLLPWAARTLQRRGRLRRTTSPDPREAAAAAWTELTATCADLDLGWPASRTPRQVALHLIDAARLEPGAAGTSGGMSSRSPGSPAADALRRLALTTERARYARTTDLVRGLADDVVVARAGLLASVDRKRRLRAQFAPISLLSRVGSRTADTFDWVDAAPRRATRVLRPRRGADRATQPTQKV